MTEALHVPPGADPDAPAPARMPGEVVRQAAAAPRVVQAGHNPLVSAHVPGLLTVPATARAVQAGLRDPEAGMHARAGEQTCSRSRTDVRRFPAGLECVPPGTGGPRWRQRGAGRVPAFSDDPQAAAAGGHQQMEE